MSIDIERLIALVHSRPPLWEQKNKNYHNRHVVDRLWNEIAINLNQKTITLKKKWKSLRDQFRQELRKIPPHRLKDITPDGEYNDIPNFPQWPYFRPLLFIKDYMKQRKTWDATPQLQQFLHEINSIENEDNNSNEKNEKYCIQSGLDLFEVETINVSQEECEMSKKLDAPQIASVGARKRKHERNSKNKLLRSDSDEDAAFFTSLLPYFGRMDPARKLLCRIEIQNIVYNHLYRNGRSVPETILQDESSQFSDDVITPTDHMQYDSKDHMFFQH